MSRKNNIYLQSVLSNDFISMVILQQTKLCVTEQSQIVYTCYCNTDLLCVGVTSGPTNVTYQFLCWDLSTRLLVVISVLSDSACLYREIGVCNEICCKYW